MADVADMRAEAATPAAWVPPAASPRTAAAIPAVPAPSGESLRVMPLVMHAFSDWLRRVGAALVGKPRHP